jgi:hypothetical protein
MLTFYRDQVSAQKRMMWSYLNGYIGCIGAPTVGTGGAPFGGGMGALIGGIGGAPFGGGMGASIGGSMGAPMGGFMSSMVASIPP